MTEATRKSSATIMVLEPDILARMAISEYLRGCGFKVVEGVRAEDALTVLRSGMAIDVVLAEVRMAGELDGLELAKQIRDGYPGTDIILTVGVGNAADRAAKLCNEGPLKKPFHPRELVTRIQLLRERRRTASTSSE
ncbi:MAG: response regulator [Rhodospirillaceae bacterium]|nr:response regulator [Rhodospirillaceae bacterium]